MLTVAELNQMRDLTTRCVNKANLVHVAAILVAEL